MRVQVFLDPATEPEEVLPVLDAVADSNLRTVHQMGAEALSTLLDEIRADRDAAYVRVQGAGAGEGASASVVGVVAETSIK